MFDFDLDSGWSPFLILDGGWGHDTEHLFCLLFSTFSLIDMHVIFVKI